MTVELLVTKESGSELAGKIHLVDEVITAEAVAEYKTLIASILGTPNLVEEGKRSVTLNKDPKAWFEALPTTYNGSHLRAQLTEK